jgi:hypothetical protein
MVKIRAATVIEAKVATATIPDFTRGSTTWMISPYNEVPSVIAGVSITLGIFLKKLPV